MLLPDTIMQISCLKDLATLRNPTSPFTFLSYLHEHNRLVSFINRGSVIPTRREYADYLKWAANKVKRTESSLPGLQVRNPTIDLLTSSLLATSTS
jgi:L-ornithine N5-oxygenase